MTPPAERLHVIGAGLIGASIAQAADAAGWTVTVEDVQTGRADQLARKLQWGSSEDRARPPDIVCVAIPPRVVAQGVAAALQTYVYATVMDVASVKAQPLADIEAMGADLSRFVPTHPLAGSEVSGPEGARAAMFRDRTWVVCPDRCGGPAVDQADALIRACGAAPLRMPAAVHDRLLAVTSHLPQLLASSLALAVDSVFAPVPVDAAAPGLPSTAGGAAPTDPSLVAGPALLDMTRVAASPAALWADIAEANRSALQSAVRRMLDGLKELDSALDAAETTRTVVTALVEGGARGRARISPKHTSAPLPAQPRLGAADPEAAWVWVDAVVDDAPGALAGLFQIADAMQVNIEDLHVDHAPHAATGVVSMAVRAQQAERLRAALGAETNPGRR